MKQVFLLFLVSILLAASAQATIRYVDKDNRSCGTGVIYCDFQTAFDAAGPGDTIRVRNASIPYTGEYDARVSGNQGAPITVEPDVGHNPNLNIRLNMWNVGWWTIQNLRWDECSTNWAPETAIYAEATGGAGSHTGIVITGNTLNCIGGTDQSNGGLGRKGYDQAAIATRSNYYPPFETLTATITNNTISQALEAGIKITHNHGTVVSGNDISGTRCGTTSGYRNASGIFLGGGAHPADQPQAVIVSKNNIHDLQTDVDCIEAVYGFPPGVNGGGIYCDAGHDGDLIEDNTIYNINWNGPSIGNNRATGIFWENRCNNATIRGNVIHNIRSGTGSGIQLAGNSSCYDSQGNQVYNNTVYDVEGDAAFTYWHYSWNNIVKNNIFGTASTGNGWAVNAGTINLCTGNVIDGNQYYRVGGGSMTWQWDTTRTSSFSTWQSLSGETNGQVADPQFLSDPPPILNDPPPTQPAPGGKKQNPRSR